MNVKTIIQLLIFFLIVIFIYFFIKNTFLKERKDIVNLDLNKDKVIEEIETNKYQSTIIENLNYISIDGKGNEYILNAKYGEESKEDSNIIILKQVVGTIKLKDKSDIEIRSDFAKYRRNETLSSPSRIDRHQQDHIQVLVYPVQGFQRSTGIERGASLGNVITNQLQCVLKVICRFNVNAAHLSSRLNESPDMFFRLNLIWDRSYQKAELDYQETWLEYLYYE